MSIHAAQVEYKTYHYIPNKNSMIISNEASCTNCDDEITSVDPLNVTACKCANVQIKGGLKEIFHTWVNPQFYKRKIIIVEDDPTFINESKVKLITNKLKIIGTK